MSGSDKLTNCSTPAEGYSNPAQPVKKRRKVQKISIDPASSLERLPDNRSRSQSAEPDTTFENNPLMSPSIRGHELCNRCSEIDIENVLKAPRSLNGRCVMSLGRIREGEKNAACALCRLFATVAVPLRPGRSEAEGGHHLRVFRLNSISTLHKVKEKVSGEPGVALGVCPGLHGKNFGELERRRCFSKGLIAPLHFQKEKSQRPQNSANYAFEVRLISQGEANFSQMRAWLQQCQKSHDESCWPRDLSRPAGFRCIDCLERHVVDVGTDENYYTLSYVCSSPGPINRTGKLTYDSQQSPSFGIPQVIEDGIKVVRELGGRYLWVDKYCIDQSNDIERDIQIKSMDKIYEGATATIIAAPGKDPSSCLPGLNGYLREQQPHAWIGPYHLVSTLPHVSIPLAGSTWKTRAWTYQEAVLSRKCFIFTDQQVYFFCRAMSCCESIAVPSEAVARSDTSVTFRTDMFDADSGTAGKEVVGLWEFFENLYQYKSRELTYDVDSLNAFQGLLTRSPFENIWGVPLACDLARGVDPQETVLSIAFARGLWWQNPGDSYENTTKRHEKYAPYRRRSHFPSWSWAGWSGPTRLHVPRTHNEGASTSKCNEVDEESFDIQFWVGVEDQRLSLREWWKSKESIPKLSPVLYIEATIHNLRIRRCKELTTQIAYICDCPPDKPHNEKNHKTHTQNVHFFEDPFTNERLRGRIFSEYSNAVQLFKLRNVNLIALWIISWENDIAHVIGVAYARHSMIAFSSPRRREFRLS